MLRALKERLPGLIVGALLVGAPSHLLFPAVPLPLVALVSLACLWLWSIGRRLMARLATRALAQDETDRARRLYTFLRYSTLNAETRQSCALSLAACVANAGDYSGALARLAGLPEVEGSLRAVGLNLHAYCLARTESDLEAALGMAEQAIELRPHVLGFRHTRGLILLELGRLEEASRDLDATWRDGDGNKLLEAERCFDLGRLWSARGHHDYATDYFERAVRALPESRWALAARPHLGARGADESLEALL